MIKESNEVYTKSNVPVGTKFQSFVENVTGVVTEHWNDRGDGLTIAWTNGNVSKLYFEELKNPRI